MHYLRTIFLTTLCTFGTSFAAKTAYNMQDLRVLSSQQNYQEYFIHAKDLKPSLRNEEWSKMTEQMGIGYLEFLNTRPKLIEKDYQLVLSISQWPIFKNDEFFREKRDQYFLKEISNCLGSGENDCIEQAEHMFNSYIHNHKFGVKLVELLYPRLIGPQKAWSFLVKMTESEFSEFFCGKSPVDEIVTSQLLITQDLQAVHPDCLKKLKPYLIQSYFEVAPKYSEDLYSLLKKLSFTNEKIDLHFKTQQFLKGKNLEITPLKKLSQDYKLREELVDLFSKAPHLVDDVLGDKVKSKKLSYIRIIDRYMPEYLNLYTNTCLDYLSGKRSFALGNPTPNCHELFSLNQELKVISSEKQRRYYKFTEIMR